METIKDLKVKTKTKTRPLYYITVSGLVGRIENPTKQVLAELAKENKGVEGLEPENNDY